MKDHISDKDDQSMVAAGSGVEPGGHSNSFQVSGIFNIYSIYIQLSSFWYIQYIFNIYSTFKLQGYFYIFPTNSVHIQYISSVQFLTVPTGIRAVMLTWRTMTNDLRRRRGVPTSRMES